MNKTSQADSRGSSSQRPPFIQEPTHEEIAVLAQHIYEEEGCMPGRDAGHWYEAERRLRRRVEGARIGTAKIAAHQCQSEKSGAD